MIKQRMEAEVSQQRGLLKKSGKHKRSEEGRRRGRGKPFFVPSKKRSSNSTVDFFGK